MRKIDIRKIGFSVILILFCTGLAATIPRGIAVTLWFQLFLLLAETI
jgi:hypothetical protein